MAAIGDSHAALAGYGSSTAGTVKATYGTGSSLMTLTDRPRASDSLASTIAWSVPAGSDGELAEYCSSLSALVRIPVPGEGIAGTDRFDSSEWLIAGRIDRRSPAVFPPKELSGG